MTRYRFTLVYVPPGVAGAGAEAGVGARETTGIKIEAEVPLSSVGAPPASLSLLESGGL